MTEETTDPKPYDPNEYPPFAVTADLVVLTVIEGELKVLLVQRKDDPHKGEWALPGGFIDKCGRDKTLEETAYRELEEETALTRSDVLLEQVRAYWSRGRDPRMEVITVSWLAFGPAHKLQPQAGSDAAEARWWNVAEARAATLAFDHNQILADAVNRADDLLQTTDAAAILLPDVFTMADLRRVYVAFWGEDAVPAPENFSRRLADVFAPASLQTAASKRRIPAQVAKAGANGVALAALPMVGVLVGSLGGAIVGATAGTIAVDKTTRTLTRKNDRGRPAPLFVRRGELSEGRPATTDIEPPFRRKR